MGKAWKGIKKGVKKVGGMLEDVYDSDIGRALTYAAIGVAAAWTGGAALGALGITSAGAAAGGGMAGAMAGGAAAAGGAAGLAGGLSGATMGYQSSQAEASMERQEAAQAQARTDAYNAQREADILQKQALLASQKSLTARKSTAAQVANNLRNTSQSVLGEDEEKLGG